MLQIFNFNRIRLICNNLKMNVLQNLFYNLAPHKSSKCNFNYVTFVKVT